MKVLLQFGVEALDDSLIQRLVLAFASAPIIMH